MIIILLLPIIYDKDQNGSELWRHCCNVGNDEMVHSTTRDTIFVCIYADINRISLTIVAIVQNIHAASNGLGRLGKTRNN